MCLFLQKCTLYRLWRKKIIDTLCMTRVCSFKPYSMATEWIWFYIYIIWMTFCIRILHCVYQSFSDKHLNISLNIWKLNDSYFVYSGTKSIESWRKLIKNYSTAIVPKINLWKALTCLNFYFFINNFK